MAEPDATRENPADGTDEKELSSIKTVIQAMVKASKAFRMYLSNNPLLQRFSRELEENMSRHLEDYGDIRLEVDQFELRYGKEIVYENTNTKDSLAFRLYSDGIRMLTFSEGLEPRELHEFVDIVGRNPVDETDDDIVTRLWERDLPHITYVEVDETAACDAEELGIRSQTSVMKERIKAAHDSAAETAPAEPPITVPQKILTLTDKEVAWLRRVKELEEQRNPMEEALHILTAILVVEKDMGLFGDFVEITTDLFRKLLHSGEIRYALAMIRFLDKLMKSKALQKELKEILSRGMEKLVTDEMIEDLADAIDKRDRINPDDMRKLIRLLGRASIKPMCSLLGKIGNRRMRMVLVESLVEIGKHSPDEFLPCLSDDKWYLVRNTILILGKIGSPLALEHAGRLIRHKERQVRKEMLLYLQVIPGEEAKGYLLEFLKDVDTSLRINAMKSLAGMKFRDALEPILKITQSRDFHKRDALERRTAFESLGEIGQEEILPLFERMILKRYWFNKAKEREMVSLAAAGLRKINTATALDVLRRAGKVKKGEAAAIVSQAIKALTREGTAETATQGGS